MRELCFILEAISIAAIFWAGIWVLDGLKYNLLLIPHTITLITAIIVNITVCAIEHHNRDTWYKTDTTENL